MISTTISPTAETFVSIVNNFGCASKAQMKQIFGERSERIANAMIDLRYIADRENMYVPIHTPSPDKMMIDCLWVALGKTKKKDGSYDLDSLKLAYRNKPVNISILANNVCYNIVGLNSDNLFSTINFLIDRYNSAKQDSRGIEYIFVLRNEDLIDEILEMEIPMPYRIVLLEGDSEEGPRLRYLKQ